MTIIGAIALQLDHQTTVISKTPFDRIYFLTSLMCTIAREKIYLSMDFSDRHIMVINSKESCCFQDLTETEGFHFLAGPNPNSHNPWQSLDRHFL